MKRTVFQANCILRKVYLATTWMVLAEMPVTAPSIILTRYND